MNTSPEKCDTCRVNPNPPGTAWNSCPNHTEEPTTTEDWEKEFDSMFTVKFSNYEWNSIPCVHTHGEAAQVTPESIKSFIHTLLQQAEEKAAIECAEHEKQAKKEERQMVLEWLGNHTVWDTDYVYLRKSRMIQAFKEDFPIN